MKVLLINGSRRESGCTNTALQMVAKSLNEQGIDTEIFFIGEKAIEGDMAGIVKNAVKKMEECDGLVVGSPVYYASPSGEVIAFLDRFFGTAKAQLHHKPAAAVVSARRGGTTASFDVLNKYFTISQMPIVSSTYWNNVHGNTPDEVKQDKEGMQIMRNLGTNMAWMLKCIEAGKKAGIDIPVAEAAEKTNFIR
ncbi:MAG: flavodoxin family protein [Lachnospiraceae bacterium]|nr:flavodoxin family protein [Lachnospiraceae bacterium]